ncbi:MAG: winged helix-turn-helix transcriptional regulator [Bacteroidales bacterium]|nr:winged helix-turn-helix transcriptional regulator [Bacteroidales bacterium]
MKKHNGMRPQDIVVLLKIIALKHNDWYNSDLAQSLKISPSVISEVLNRCKMAGLIDSKKRKVNINSFIEFLIYGFRYVIPTQPGAIVKGIPTAHSASPIKEHISSGSDIYVWANAKGTHRGQAIEPLFKSIPKIVQEDKGFYELLIIIDTIRAEKGQAYAFINISDQNEKGQEISNFVYAFKEKRK